MQQGRPAALAAAQHKYLGRPCQRDARHIGADGFTPRYTSNAICVACQKERNDAKRARIVRMLPDGRRGAA